MNDRECGSCSECCTALEVRSIAKPARSKCDKLVRPGQCSVYSERPYDCQMFLCFWLRRFGEESERPDKSGVIVHWTMNELMDMPAINVVESREGEFKRNDSLLEMARAMHVPCVQFEHFDGHMTIYSTDKRYIDMIRRMNNLDIPPETYSIEMELRNEP